jgi:hypothetical protein
MQAPVFTSIDSIYPGPHIGADGKIDNRIWFHIPVDLDIENDYVTYIVFPYGAADEEIQEITVAASGSWTD